MAGGAGARLRPLTCDRPKPMVPVAGRPVLAYTLDLLQRHRVAAAAVTLQYRADDVRRHFGRQAGRGPELRYHVEDRPLGTAGSVRALARWLDQTFFVLSGDALTDCDLTALLAFHRQRGAAVTLGLAQNARPQEYGIVLTAADGRIVRFDEKPDQGEAFSDLVNTGIYVLEPHVLSYIPTGRAVDFSQDLFPRLLAAGLPLYGCLLDGYWCDIGDLTAYLMANLDLLHGRLAHHFGLVQTAPGIWCGADVQLSADAVIEGPAVLGAGCRIEGGARLSEGVVVGAGCLIGAGASLKRSVIWDGTALMPGAALRGVVAAERVYFGRRSAAYEGAVVGSQTRIGEGALIEPGVCIWPAKRVEPGARVRQHLIWGRGARADDLHGGRLQGRVGVELLPETAVRVGRALGAALPAAGGVVLGSGRGRSCDLIRQALACGLMAAGRLVLDAGRVAPPALAHAVSNLAAAGGAHVAVGSGAEQVIVTFYAAGGGPPGRDLERRVQRLLQGATPMTRAALLGSVQAVSGVEETYLQHLEQTVDSARVQAAQLAVHLAPSAGWELALRWLQRLGCRVEAWPAAAALRAGIRPDGRLLLWDSDGRPLSEAVVLALAVWLELEEQTVGAGPIDLPVWAPHALEELVRRAGRTPRRCPRSQWRPADPLLLLGRLLAWLAPGQHDLQGALANLPQFTMASGAVGCPESLKAPLLQQHRIHAEGGSGRAARTLAARLQVRPRRWIQRQEGSRRPGGSGRMRPKRSPSAP